MGVGALRLSAILLISEVALRCTLATVLPSTLAPVLPSRLLIALDHFLEAHQFYQ